MFTHFLDIAHLPKNINYNLQLKFSRLKSAHAQCKASPPREIINPHMLPELRMSAISTCRTYFEFSPKEFLTVPTGEFKTHALMISVVRR